MSPLLSMHLNLAPCFYFLPLTMFHSLLPAPQPLARYCHSVSLSLCLCVFFSSSRFIACITQQFPHHKLNDFTFIFPNLLHFSFSERVSLLISHSHALSITSHIQFHSVCVFVHCLLQAAHPACPSCVGRTPPLQCLSLHISSSLSVSATVLSRVCFTTRQLPYSSRPKGFLSPSKPTTLSFTSSCVF